MFKKKDSEPVILKVEPKSPILCCIEKQIEEIERMVREREGEITKLTVRLVELDVQAAWLKRHPEAIDILKSISQSTST